MNLRRTASALALALALAASAGANAQGDRYEITVTNITTGQTFTPILAATHKARMQLFTLGEAASPELADLAEGGDTAPLDSYLASFPNDVYATAGTDGLLGPGESVTFTIDSAVQFNRFSLAAMLIPTNDTIVAANNLALPNRTRMFLLNAYDAGSELNDESCANIPGPFCGGEGSNSDDGEGYVHFSNGIHGGADLDPAMHDWRNAVAHIKVSRID